ncbi:MAG: transposase [Phycisphaeraceae bacterium]|nr:transposase [Phycisphaeraceae bacterium]
MGEAVHDVLNQTEALTRYLDDGRLAIDNYARERSLRGNAIGRKNWLFTDFRGRRLPGAATMFSLISSAKRNHIEPTAYLNDLFTRLPETSTDKLTQFLPDHWQPQARTQLPLRLLRLLRLQTRG